LLVGLRGHTFLIEIKVPGETLNPLQKQYHRRWVGSPIHVAFTVQQIIEIVHGYRRRVVPCPTN
jgi:hypothetical protein